MSNIRLEIPSPPKETYQQNKQLVQGKDPLLNEKNVIHIIEKMEWVKWQGALVYFKGAKFPKRYFPTPDAVYAVNQVKKLLKLSIFSFVFSKDRNIVLHDFNTVANRCLVRFHNDNGEAKLETHKRNLELVSPTTLYVAEFVCNVLISIGIQKETAIEFGVIMGHIFEYDDAWRAMFQDICTEMNVDRFVKSPNKEFRRLYKIYLSRQTIPYVRQKFKIIILPLQLALYVPKYRKAITQHIHLLKNCKFDDADWYWANRRSEYNFGGLTWEKRKPTVDILESYEVTT